MGHARLTFDDRHERVAKSDGAASTCRAMKVKLLGTPQTSVNAVNRRLV
jgi:hypothetical protein